MSRILSLAMLAALLVPVSASARMAEPEYFVGDVCASAADCPVEFTCEGVTLPCAPEPGCACPPCREGESCEPCDCPDVEQSECTPTTEQRCVWRPQPCDEDADCTTAGFECQLQEECSGSGCACRDCPPGEECPPCDCSEEEEQVDCTVIGGFCVPGQTPCAADTECASGWECADVGGGETCDCACAPCPEGQECEACDCSCTDEEAGGMCLPAGWEEQVQAGIGMGGGASGGDPRSPPELDGSADDPEEEEDEDGYRLGCTAAGSGGAASLIAMAIALGFLQRRRR